jgi:DNA-binding MarR family transcriptional regulator
MEYGQMHQLGKRLIELSGVMTGAPGDRPLTLGEVAVLEDAVAHPGASIREIHQRSGFAQSHVSASVVRLKKRGLLTTLGDPAAGSRASAWRAHTYVQATDDALEAISRRQARGVSEADLRGAVGLSQAKRAIRLMEELAEILL